MILPESEYLSEDTRFLMQTLCHEVLENLQFIGTSVAFLQQIKDEVEPVEQLDVALTKIEEGSNLVKDISRLTEVIGKPPQHNNYPPVDLRANLQDVTKRVSDTITHCGLVIAEPDETEPILIGSFYGDTLHRALELILGNLAALTPEGNVLQIRLSTAGGQASISIQGIGVEKYGKLSPAELTQSLLDNMPSVGTSMNLVKKIIYLHNGNFSSSNTNDCLIINLPLVV